MTESGAPTKLARPKTAAKKKREKAGRNSPQTPLPPRLPCGAGLGVGSVSAILQLAEYQNRKIFFSF
jgi:D-serine dehydratase